MMNSLPMALNRFRDIVKSIIVSLCPVHKKWIVFDCFNGRGLGDSPGAIANEILKRKLPCRLFWLVNPGEEINLPNGITPVRIESVKARLITASSRLWIDNVKNCFTWPKKKNQFYIQTWHGGGLPLKEVERQAEQFLSKHYLKLSKQDSTKTDMVLADNNLIAEIYRNWFWYPSTCQIARLGLPKNDVLFQDNDLPSLKRVIFGKEDVHIALYAPTFRDDDSVDGYRIDLQALHAKLEEKYGEKWVVAVRLHPNLRNRSGEFFIFDENIIDATAYPNPEDLVIASDILITDYSSIMSDFLVLNKPVFLLLLDLEHYLTHCRSIGQIFYQLPFPRCYSNEELLRAVASFNLEQYLSSIRLFKKDCYISYDDGHAAERVVDRIEELIGQ